MKVDSEQREARPLQKLRESLDLDENKGIGWTA